MRKRKAERQSTSPAQRRNSTHRAPEDNSPRQLLADLKQATDEARGLIAVTQEELELVRKSLKDAITTAQMVTEQSRLTVGLAQKIANKAAEESKLMDQARLELESYAREARDALADARTQQRQWEDAAARSRVKAIRAYETAKDAVGGLDQTQKMALEARAAALRAEKPVYEPEEPKSFRKRMRTRAARDTQY